jgi:hypothetical protein
MYIFVPVSKESIVFPSTLLGPEESETTVESGVVDLAFPFSKGNSIADEAVQPMVCRDN